MGRKKSDDTCEICGRLLECRVTAYQHTPFIDGRYYDHICMVCGDVPNMHHFDPKTEILTAYKRWDPGRLQTVEMMISDGWDKREATDSIKAVKQAIKSKLGKNPSPDPNPEVLWARYCGDKPIEKTPEPPKLEPQKTKGKKKPQDEDLDLDDILDLDDEPARPKKPPKYGNQATPRAKAG